MQITPPPRPSPGVPGEGERSQVSGLLNHRQPRGRALDYDVLLAELDAHVRPGLDVRAQRLLAWFELFAVDAAIRGGDAVFVAHGEQSDADEQVGFDRWLERFERSREQATRAERVLVRGR